MRTEANTNGVEPLRRHRGHPKVDPDGPGAQIRIRLKAKTYDELYRLAVDKGLSLPALIRSAIDQHLVNDRRDVTRPS